MGRAKHFPMLLRSEPLSGSGVSYMVIFMYLCKLQAKRIATALKEASQ